MIYLEGKVLSWYNDNINSLYHQKNVWSFKEVITGLYNCFVHDTATYNTSEKFQHVQYQASGGIMSYYNKLEHYVSRMIRAPDRLMFKTQLMTGLPDNILLHILQKGCMTEKSSTEAILYYAR